MNSQILKIVALSFFLLLPGIASANLIKVDLTGTVTDVQGRYVLILDRRGGIQSSIINIGDSISFSFIYSETPASTSGTSENYLDAISSFTASVGGYQFSGERGLVELANDQVESGRVNRIFDQLLFSFAEADFLQTTGSIGYDLDDNSINTDLFNNNLDAKSPLSSVILDVSSDDSLFDSLDLTEQTTQLAFSDLSLPTFNMRFGEVRGNFFLVDGQFDSVKVTNLTAVPVPAAFFLFCTGFFGLLGLRKAGG